METKELNEAIIKQVAPNVMMQRGDALDADTMRSAGSFVTRSNTLNIPPGFNNGVIEVIPRPPSEAFQRITSWTGTKIAVRTGGTSSWSAWRIYEPSSTYTPT